MIICGDLIFSCWPEESAAWPRVWWVKGAVRGVVFTFFIYPAGAMAIVPPKMKSGGVHKPKPKPKPKPARAEPEPEPEPEPELKRGLVPEDSGLICRVPETYDAPKLSPPPLETPG